MIFTYYFKMTPLAACVGIIRGVDIGGDDCHSTVQQGMENAGTMAFVEVEQVIPLWPWFEGNASRLWGDKRKRRVKAVSKI